MASNSMYYIGQGAKEWQGFRGDPKMRGAEQDKDICLIKSGTDFRDLSEALFELEDTPEGSIRRKVVKSLSGKHHEITPETPTSEGIETLVKSLLSTVSDALSKPVCFSLTPFDVRSEIVRTEETAIGNWVADILMHAYSERLSDIQDDQANQGIKSGEADAVIVCAGGFRADSVYPAGEFSLYRPTYMLWQLTKRTTP
jgi:5'-nucleotidase